MSRSLIVLLFVATPGFAQFTLTTSIESGATVANCGPATCDNAYGVRQNQGKCAIATAPTVRMHATVTNTGAVAANRNVWVRSGSLVSAPAGATCSTSPYPLCTWMFAPADQETFVFDIPGSSVQQVSVTSDTGTTDVTECIHFGGAEVPQIVVTSTADHIPATSQATITVTVSSASGTPADGDVIFLVDGTPLIVTGTLLTNRLYQGKSSFNTGQMPAGVHTIQAGYLGSSTLAPGMSNVLMQTVDTGLQPTTTTIDVWPRVISYLGQTIQITGHALKASGLPGWAYGFIALDIDGVLVSEKYHNGYDVTWNIDTLSAGTHTLRLRYEGDATDAPSQTEVQQTVLSQPYVTTSTSVVAMPDVAPPGAPVTITATVATSDGSNPPLPVSFVENTVTLAQVPVVAGKATWVTSSLTPGYHSVFALYAYGLGYSASYGVSNRFFIGTQLPTVTTLTVPATIEPPQASVTVTVASSSGVPSEGSVDVLVDGAVVGTQTIQTWPMYFQLFHLTPGTHTILAAYRGSLAFQSSISTTATILVSPFRTATSVGFSPDSLPLIAGRDFKLVANVTALSAGMTGTVTFTINGQPIGTARVVGGSASLTVLGGLPMGMGYTLGGQYSGSSDFAPSTAYSYGFSVYAPTTLTLSPVTIPTEGAALYIVGAVDTPATGVSKANGYLSLSEGDRWLGAAYTAADGRATVTVPGLTAGTHTLKGFVSFDWPLLSASATLTVNVAPMPVREQADVSCSINGPTNVVAGVRSSYVVTVLNAGPNTAHSTSLIFGAPAAAILSAPANCSQFGLVMMCSLGDVAAGANVTLPFDVVFLTTQHATLSATVNASDGIVPQNDMTAVQVDVTGTSRRRSAHH
jgi:Big-like domain-containing protein